MCCRDWANGDCPDSYKRGMLDAAEMANAAVERLLFHGNLAAADGCEKLFEEIKTKVEEIR
jgi:hypothetical protein